MPAAMIPGIILTRTHDSLRDALAWAAASGAAQVVLDLRAWQSELGDLSRTGHREVATLLARKGVSLAGIQVELGRDGLRRGTDADQALDKAVRGIKLVRNLGGKALMLDAVTLGKRFRAATPGATGEGKLLLPFMPAPAQPAADAGVEPGVLEALGAAADRDGVLVALRATLSGTQAASEAVTASRCPWFGLDLDPADLLTDEVGIEGRLVQLAPSAHHVRLRDAVAGEGGRVRIVPPGEGSVDWPAMLRQLESGGYRGLLSIDPGGLDQPRPAILKGLRLAGLEGSSQNRA